MVNKPLFKIGAHVFYYMVGFTLTVAPIVIYASYFGQTDEQKVEMLKAKYPDDYKKNLEKRSEYKEFFDKMKNHENDAAFREVLKGGKGDMKRNYEPDKKKEPVSTGTSSGTNITS